MSTTFLNTRYFDCYCGAILKNIYQYQCWSVADPANIIGSTTEFRTLST